MCMVREGCWELTNATLLFPSQIGHNVKEIAHDCVMALKAWSREKGSRTLLILGMVNANDRGNMCCFLS